MASYKIALIPGDGIGKEVLPEAVTVLEKVGGKFGISFEWSDFDWSCETYAKTGRMMPEDGLEQLRRFAQLFVWLEYVCPGELEKAIDQPVQALGVAVDDPQKLLALLGVHRLQVILEQLDRAANARERRLELV